MPQTGDLEITIRVPDAPRFWGDDLTEEEARQAAELHAERLLEWARERGPEALIETEIVHETMARSYSAVEWSGDETDGTWTERSDIVRTIHNRAEETWGDDLRDAVAEGA